MKFWEQKALEALGELAGRDPALARTFAGLPWILDDMTFRERLVIEAFVTLADAAPDSVASLLQPPWLGDGLTEMEEQSLWVIGRLAATGCGLMPTYCRYRGSKMECRRIWKPKPWN